MDTVSISEDLVNKLSGEMTVVVAADSSNSNLEKLNEAVTTASGNKTRKSRRRRTRNTNVTNSDSKRVAPQISDGQRKSAGSTSDPNIIGHNNKNNNRDQRPQKLSSQTSCSSVPLTTGGCSSTSLLGLQFSNTSQQQHQTPLRPRSLYTTHTYQQHQRFQSSSAGPEEAGGCFRSTINRPPSWPSRSNEEPRYLEAPSSVEQSWYQHTNIPPSLWRQQQPPSRSFNPKSINCNGLQQQQIYIGDELTCTDNNNNWRDDDLLDAAGSAGAITTSHGTITLRLRNKIRLDMTIDRAVRLINFKNNIVLSLSGSGSASALLHPNGRIYQYGSRVEIMAHDSHAGNNKYAKMWYKGVSFTSEQCALVYLVDAAGARTTTDSFSDMSHDFSLNVFYAESRHGPAYVQEASAALSAAQYWITDEGIENWIINNVRISQTPDGLVRIARNSNKYQLRTSPSNGTASLTTPFLHCTASLGQTPHLFVRRGERRMHYDGTSFIVRNAGHSAGFDDNNQLKVY